MQLAGLNITMKERAARLQLGVNESYSLSIPASQAFATLHAATQDGIYHGSETLLQLIQFDAYNIGYVIEKAPVKIVYAPRFPHREVFLDTARHFQP